MDTSKKGSNKRSSFYIGQSFLWSFRKLNFQSAFLVFLIYTVYSGYALYCSFELYKYKDAQAEFEKYWRDEISESFVIEHKLQKGDQLWFFMKDLKTGKTIEKNDVSPGMYVEKNEGDTVTFKSKRIDKDFQAYMDTSGPAIENMGEFKAVGMNGVSQLLMGFIYLCLLFNGYFVIDDKYSKSNILEREVTEAEIKVDELVRTLFVLGWFVINVFVMVRGIMYCSI